VSDSTQDSATADLFVRDREVAHLAFNFVLDMAAHGISGLKTLECLLLMAINQANIAPLTRDPEARIRYGALEHPAPDAERRPVSVRAVAASMRLPYETARRNIRRLEVQGVCVVNEAGVVVTGAFMLSPAYLQAAQLGHERVHALYRMLQAGQLLEPLPPANYDEREPPIRGAVRLISDFLLRASEAIVGRTGDLVSTLVILPLLAASAGTDAEASPPQLSVATIARRCQLPAETVRRHAAALVLEGVCESSARGLTLADHRLASPGWRSLLRENAVAVQRMFAGLSERGVVAAWEQAANGGAGSAHGAA
jgi:DNA-binding IclR family transcriptional regulator